MIAPLVTLSKFLADLLDALDGFRERTRTMFEETTPKLCLDRIAQTRPIIYVVVKRHGLAVRAASGRGSALSAKADLL